MAYKSNLILWLTKLILFYGLPFELPWRGVCLSIGTSPFYCSSTTKFVFGEKNIGQ